MEVTGEEGTYLRNFLVAFHERFTTSLRVYSIARADWFSTIQEEQTVGLNRRSRTKKKLRSNDGGVKDEGAKRMEKKKEKKQTSIKREGKRPWQKCVCIRSTSSAALLSYVFLSVTNYSKTQ